MLWKQVLEVWNYRLIWWCLVSWTQWYHLCGNITSTDGINRFFSYTVFILIDDHALIDAHPHHHQTPSTHTKKLKSKIFVSKIHGLEVRFWVNCYTPNAWLTLSALLLEWIRYNGDTWTKFTKMTYWYSWPTVHPCRSRRWSHTRGGCDWG